MQKISFGKISLKLLPFFFLAIPLNVASYFLLSKFQNPLHWSLQDWALSVLSTGAILISIICLLFEVYYKGFQNSSLASIIQEKPSSRVDMFYAFVYVSNLKIIFGIIFSGGTLWLYQHFSKTYFDFFLLSENSLPVQFLIYFSATPLLFYLNHRIMHTKLFWRIHQVHHSATEMVMITNFRNHPLGFIIESLLYWTSGWILGVHVSVVITYQVLNGIYQLFAHSKFTWNLRGTKYAWIQDWILISPEEHRLHHSVNPEHWGKNFGIFPFWERLFGTWMPYELSQEPLVFGVNEMTNQSEIGSIKGMFDLYFEFIASLFNFFRKKI